VTTIAPRPPLRPPAEGHRPESRGRVGRLERNAHGVNRPIGPTHPQLHVMPAKSGTHGMSRRLCGPSWVRAFAGMTLWRRMAECELGVARLGLGEAITAAIPGLRPSHGLARSPGTQGAASTFDWSSAAPHPDPLSVRDGERVGVLRDVSNGREPHSAAPPAPDATAATVPTRSIKSVNGPTIGGLIVISDGTTSEKQLVMNNRSHHVTNVRATLCDVWPERVQIQRSRNSGAAVCHSANRFWSI
jgi:hypothetical protein